MHADEILSTYFLPVGLAFFMGYMLFIIWKLGKDSKAGKFGMVILFIVLGFGMFGFLIKTILVEVMGIG
ncbi:uncharacterized protein DUF2788 [Alkalispirillum mobile]|uniref:Uncharacterized protein DUF2788 n=1 Tax=Alkalispirillum mobile TaxID=85925 RepID=A0A498CDY1_9GAMM|nr:DUF2788 domain-containing protein [Alkalispirillum mobile]RLK51520.1 uncharacterized protein DUF2788 [Alkalispirillum mobile]